MHAACPRHWYGRGPVVCTIIPRQLLTHVQGCTGRAGSAEARRVHVPPRSIVTKRAAPRRSIPLNISPRLPVTHLSSRLSRRRREEELELESSYACQAYTVFDSYDEHVRRIDAARLFYQKRPAVKPAGGWGGLAWKPPPRKKPHKPHLHLSKAALAAPSTIDHRKTEPAT